MSTRMFKPLAGVFSLLFVIAVFPVFAQQNTVQKVSAFYLAQGAPSYVNEPGQLPPPAPSLGAAKLPSVDVDAVNSAAGSAIVAGGPPKSPDGFQSANHPIFGKSGVQTVPAPAVSSPMSQRLNDLPSSELTAPNYAAPTPRSIGPTEMAGPQITLEQPSSGYVAPAPGGGCSDGGAGAYYLMLPPAAAGCSSGGSAPPSIMHAAPRKQLFYVTSPARPACDSCQTCAEPASSCCSEGCGSSCGCGEGGLLGKWFGKKHAKCGCGSQNCGCNPSTAVRAESPCTCETPPIVCASPCSDACGVTCGDSCCAPCGSLCGFQDPCCPKFYGSAEYLLWWTRGMNLPDLVTTSPEGTPVDQAGLFGLAGTSTLFGGNQEALLHSGGRYSLGINLDCTGCDRLEANYMFLTDEGEDYDRFGGADGTILTRPYNNTLTGLPDAELVGFPGVVDGRVRVDTKTEFQGFGVLWRHNLSCCKPCGGQRGLGPCQSYNADFCGGYGSCGVGGGCFQSRGIELLLGYRHFELDEQVRIQENLVTTGADGDIPSGTSFDIVDQFRTENKFDGFDVGLNWEGGMNRWGLGLVGKVAFGRTSSRAIIDGSTLMTTPDAEAVFNRGGLLALDSNIGQYDSEQFSAIPEFGACLYYSLGRHGRFRFGYNFIYWADVLRPGGIIDTNVDPRLLPPATTPNTGQPQFVANREDFWAQGLTFGFDFCF